ncbi:MAG: hypothetical protein O7G87_24080 [bacterium]|nr:hypothetical protein [bacterium]
MSRFLKQWRLLALTLPVFLFVCTYSAQAIDVFYTTSRHLTRSLVWLSFTNTGTSSMTYNETASRVMMRQGYPGGEHAFYAQLGGEDFLNYWGYKGYLSFSQKSSVPMHSAGEGVLVLTNVDGEKWVSASGPRQPTEDIFPMIYDIQNQREATWGFENRVPARGLQPGLHMTNWWPGAPTQEGVDPIKSSPYEIHNFDYFKYNPHPDAPESVNISQWTTKHNVVVTRKVYAWSHQDFDDFILLEVEFDNRGDKQLNDTYFGFMNTFYVNSMGTAWRWRHEGGLIRYNRFPGGNDDWFKSSLAPNFSPNPLSGLTVADFADKYINYQYDGNLPQSFEEDTGDPYDVELRGRSAWFPGSTDRPKGTATSQAYVGIAPLAFRNAGASHVFNARDKAADYVDPKGETPILQHNYTVHSRRNIDDPTNGSLSPAEMYDFLISASTPQPDGEQMQWNDQIYGPYDLGPGQKAKIVIVYVYGSGSEFVDDPATGYPIDTTRWAWTLGGSTDDQRKDELAKGERGLLQNLSHAQFAYDADYAIPNSPPDIDFIVRSNEDANLETVWKGDAESAINPDYGEADVVAYRVYRSDHEEYGPWHLVGEVPATGASEYVFKDPNSLAGFTYNYNLRAVIKGRSNWSKNGMTMADLPPQVSKHVQAGLEGGYSAPEQKVIVSQSPQLASGTATNNLEKKVTVVPNPFSIERAASSYGGALKVRFVGVPNKCTIHIYTISGDKMGIIEHDDPAIGEASWDLKDRFITGEATTGLYFFVVESHVRNGQTQIGSFIIHR